MPAYGAVCARRGQGLNAQAVRAERMVLVSRTWPNRRNMFSTDDQYITTSFKLITSPTSTNT